MISILEQSGKTATYRTEFLCDKKNDIQELPIHPNTAFGSVALCLEDKKVYILSNANEWVEV